MPEGKKSLKRARSVEASPPLEQAPPKTKYKTIMEQVVVKKKPLTLVSVANEPLPNDYLLVKYGNADFTKFCMNKARKDDAKVWVARNDDRKTKRPKSRGSLTHEPNPTDPEFHINRLGYYFPKKVVEQACHWFGMKLASSGDLIVQSNAKTQMTQGDLRTHFEEIYPKMPDLDRDLLVERIQNRQPKHPKHHDVNPYTKIELVVIAHIRHRHTDYDMFLRTGYTREDARRECAPELLKTLSEWKGESGAEEWETEFKVLIDLTEDLEDSDEYSPMPITNNASPVVPSVEPIPPPPRTLATPTVPPRLPPPPPGYRLNIKPLPPGATVVDLCGSSPLRGGGDDNARQPEWMRSPKFEWLPHPVPQGRIALRRLSPPTATDSRPSPPRANLAHLPPPPPNMAWRRLSADQGHGGYMPAPKLGAPPPPPPPSGPGWVRYGGGSPAPARY